MAGGTIRTEANGPYVVTGPITIIDAEGNEQQVPEGHTVKLCRCGHSAKKPFCDSTHRRVDFVSRPAFLPEEQTERR
jgi:CDGSH-type Zn-finger protein